jgi:rhodanese-related sulfurtransferase
MMTGQQGRLALLVILMLMSAVAASTKAQPQLAPYGRDPPNVFDGVLSNVAGSSEISTAQLRAALNDGSAIILDARPYEEYDVSHIPGARAVPAKAGTTPALYVGDAAEVAKTIPDQTQPLILYCNGLFCGRSERLADDLIKLVADTNWAPPAGGPSAVLCRRKSRHCCGCSRRMRPRC